MDERNLPSFVPVIWRVAGFHIILLQEYENFGSEQNSRDGAGDKVWAPSYHLRAPI